MSTKSRNQAPCPSKSVSWTPFVSNGYSNCFCNHRTTRSGPGPAGRPGGPVAAGVTIQDTRQRQPRLFSARARRGF
eukprot:760848-Hanusia_phi.AAC.1